ncbi:PadR family transcriptional regulator [Marinibaculum pumilum]|uniref:PadR family transcriptional regulator n=1 Tax=Marinibaculum pumilum TaxID=1766165 RepID=A0ABV7KTS5_9PROT
MFGPGDLRLVLLALVAEQPRHGYELIKAIEEKFGGTYAPSPGSVYPTLTLLEELGQVAAATTEGAKRLFEITEEGRAFLAENKAAVDGVMERMAMAARAMTGEAPPEVIFEAMHTLKAALRFHRAGWDDAETERVRAILVRAAREIGAGETGEGDGE